MRSASEAWICRLAKEFSDRNRLQRIQKRDDEYRERQRIINQHEAFIYDSQSRLEDEEFVEFSSEEEREKISKLLSENEDWLMDEATNETPSSEYKQRYLDMKTAMNRVEERIDDHKRKLEEERKAKEEAEKKAKEEAEKKAKEEEEAKKKAEEEKEAEKKATEEEEAEKKAKEEEAEKKAKEDGTETSSAAESTNATNTENQSEAAKTQEAENDEGMCSINGCSDENTDL